MIKRKGQAKVCNVHNMEFFCQCQTCNYTLLCLKCLATHNQEHRIINIQNATIPKFVKVKAKPNPANIYRDLTNELLNDHFVVEIHKKHNKNSSDSEDFGELSDYDFSEDDYDIYLINITKKKTYLKSFKQFKNYYFDDYTFVKGKLFFHLLRSEAYFFFDDKTDFFCVDLTKVPLVPYQLESMPFFKNVANYVDYNGFIYAIGWDSPQDFMESNLKYRIANDKWFKLPEMPIDYENDEENPKAITCIFDNRYILCIEKRILLLDLYDEENGWHEIKDRPAIAEKLSKCNHVIQDSNQSLLFLSEDGLFFRLNLRHGRVQILNIESWSPDVINTKKYYIKGHYVWIQTCKRNYCLYYLNLWRMNLKKFYLKSCKNNL